MSKVHGVEHWQPDSCFGCKIRTLQFGESHFRPHFNWSVGKYVTSEQDFKDKLKIAAEDNSIRTGTTHTYEYRHPEDVKPFSASDQVLEDRARNLSKIRAGVPL